MKPINLPPYAPILMESTRAIGYSLEAAIADVVDNSIAAEARNINVNFFPVGQEYVYILDDGHGMNSDGITNAMQYGSKNPNDIRNLNDLGRFGLGLKTASLSQCRMLTVVSKQSDSIVCRQWDLDYIAETEEWTLKELDINEVEKVRDLLARVSEFIEDMRVQYENKNVLVVAHSAILRAIHYAINGIPEDGKFLNLGLKNTEVKEYNL